MKTYVQVIIIHLILHIRNTLFWNFPSDIHCLKLWLNPKWCFPFFLLKNYSHFVKWFNLIRVGQNGWCANETVLIRHSFVANLFAIFQADENTVIIVPTFWINWLLVHTVSLVASDQSTSNADFTLMIGANWLLFSFMVRVCVCVCVYTFSINCAPIWNYQATSLKCNGKKELPEIKMEKK